MRPGARAAPGGHYNHADVALHLRGGRLKAVALHLRGERFKAVTLHLRGARFKAVTLHD